MASSLPNLEQTWQFAVNQVTAPQGSMTQTAAAVMFKLKNSLCTFGSNPWTVVKSSNSSTAGTSDLWTSSAAITFADAGSAHSWIVLQQAGVTGGPLQILIDCNLHIASSITLRASPSAGFTGGSITTAPTATDQQLLNDANNLFLWTINSNSQTILHVIQSTTGKSTRILVMSGGAVQSCWLFEELVDSLLTTKAVVSWTSINGSQATAFTLSGYYANAAFQGKFGANLLTAYVGTEGYNSTTVVQANSNGISNITSAYPIAALSAHSQTASCQGRLGRFSDLYFGSPSVPTGSTYPAGGSATFAQFNPFVLPWNGTTVTIT